MEPSELNLFYYPKDRLRLTVGEDRSYVTVKPVWASPLSHPGEFLALLDGKGEEVALIPDPADLPLASREAVENELHCRYLTACVSVVRSAKQEFGATYWSVETNRGPRDFVTQNLQENALWFSESHLLLVDVDGNRFEIPCIPDLDVRSQALIHSIL